MKKKTLMRRISVAEISLAAVLVLWLWTDGAEQEAHIVPEYPREDISSYVNNEEKYNTGKHDAEKDKAERDSRQELTREDYDLLFRQTGLAQSAVEAMQRAGRLEELLEIQENYFEEVQICCESNTIISRAEYLVEPGGGQKIPVIEEGDILINFNCHFFGWRSGHAAIVTDAQKRQTLEARVLGTETAILSLDRWQEYPSFAVLRLKDVSREERKKIAAYAAENLTDIPYRLTAGLWEEETPSGTQCAHLVWYVYKHFGFDLDSDGGRIVTPRDLYESPCLEIIQIYGMEEP